MVLFPYDSKIAVAIYAAGANGPYACLRQLLILLRSLESSLDSQSSTDENNTHVKLFESVVAFKLRISRK